MRTLSRDRDERGAVIPFIALLMVVIIGMAMLAVDLGMQRVARQDMQRLADAVALDLSRLIDGRTASAVQAGDSTRSSLSAARAASVSRNSTNVLGRDTTVTATLITLDSAGAPVLNPDGSVKAASGTTVPDAVLIRALTTVDFSFAPGFGQAGNAGDGSGSGSGTHTPGCSSGCSIGVPRANACFQLGSFVAGIDTAQANLLNTIMPSLLHNTTFSTTLVGYQGLASSNLTLAQLVGVSDLGVGSADELLKLNGLTLGRFYAAMATALQANGGSTAAVTLLNTLSTKANLTSTIAIADLLGIETARTAALSAKFDVLDLVVGAAQLANGTNAFTIPSLTTQIPGLTSMTTSLTLGEKPKLACGEVGKAKATTGQGYLKVTGNVADVTNNVTNLTTPLGGLGAVVGGLLAGITNGVLSGPLVAKTATESEVTLAQATGQLTKIVCGAATSAANAEGIDVAVTASALSVVSTKETVSITGSLDLKITNLLGITLKIATITVDITKSLTMSTSANTTATNVSFRHPSDNYGTAKSFGTGILMPTLTSPTVSSTDKVRVTFLPGYGTTGDVAITGIPVLQTVLNTLLTSATSTVNNSLVTPLNTSVIPQLQTQLGIKVGGADLFTLEKPSCQDPALAG